MSSSSHQESWIPAAKPAVVVVGVDGSDASKDALRWAAHYAGLIGGRLRVVTAWHWPTLTAFSMPFPEGYDPGGDALKSLDALVATELGEPSAVAVTTRAGCGPPASVLLEETPGASMLVVGSRGHGGFAGLLLGSTSEQCARHAPCPVTIIRHHDTESSS